MSKYQGKGIIRSVNLDASDGVAIVSLAPESMTMPKGTEYTIKINTKEFCLSKKLVAGMAVSLVVENGRVTSVIDWN